MAVDPKDITQPDINVYVSQLCEELRALKNRVNLMEGREVRAPEGETLNVLPAAALRALKTLSFDALGNVVADAPIAGDYSAYAVELANRLKRDGTQAMLAELLLAGNAVTALGAVPKQQMEAADAVVRTYAQQVGSPKIAQLFESNKTEMRTPSVVVKTEDGRLISWGRGDAYSLATGVNQNIIYMQGLCVYEPPIPDGVSVAGFTHGDGGNLYAWLSNGWCYYAGPNEKGQGGQGSTTAKTILSRIEYFVTNSISIVDVKFVNYRPDVGNYNFAYFVTSLGHVYFAGRATAAGMAGDGIGGDRTLTTPVRCGTLADLVGFTAPAQYNGTAYAWLANGSCYAWGRNGNGEAGLGDTAARLSPTLIPGLAVSKVATATATNAAGTDYSATLFLLQDGTVRGAGVNSAGELGNGTTVQATSPVVASGLASITTVDLFGGDGSTAIAVDSTGNLWAWGNNSQYQCGDGTNTHRSTPQKPAGWIDVNNNVVATSGDPPFQGKVVKVIGHKSYASGPVGWPFLLVLDSDGNLWHAGVDRCMLTGTSLSGVNQRFKKVKIPPLLAGDKIVDIALHGNSTTGSWDYRIYARTQHGKLLGSGTNSFGVLSAGLADPTYIMGLQPIPIVI